MEAMVRRRLPWGWRRLSHGGGAQWWWHPAPGDLRGPTVITVFIDAERVLRLGQYRVATVQVVVCCGGAEAGSALILMLQSGSTPWSGPVATCRRRSLACCATMIWAAVCGSNVPDRSGSRIAHNFASPNRLREGGWGSGTGRHRRSSPRLRRDRGAQSGLYYAAACTRVITRAAFPTLP